MKNEYKSENIKSEDEFTKFRKWVDKQMSKQKLLYNRLVANYHRMMTNCKVYEEQLERINTENERYKFVAQCLMNKVEDLTGHCVEKQSTEYDQDNDCNENDPVSLEVRINDTIYIIVSFLS